ncbi:hypothetical protein LTSERUB_0207, partial [Salmonella enterica subsp. enterica serovar Rubislaw str. A4-653]
MCCHQVGRCWHYCRRALRLFGLALNTDKKAQATARCARTRCL